MAEKSRQLILLGTYLKILTALIVIFGLAIGLATAIGKIQHMECVPTKPVEGYSGLGTFLDGIVNRQAFCISEREQPVAFLLRKDIFQAEVSPDGHYWVIWKAISLFPISYNYPPDRGVYAYNPKRDELVFLGRITRNEHHHVQQWLEQDGVLLYSGDMPEWSEKRYWYASLTTTNSLRPVIDARATYLDNPPRYFYVNSASLIERRYGSASNGIPCIITEFLLETAETREFRVADDCYDVYPPSRRGERDYLVILKADATQFDEYGNPSIAILESVTFDPSMEEP